MPTSRLHLRWGRISILAVGLVLVLAIAFYLPVTVLAPVASISATRVDLAIAPTTAPKYSLPSYGASGIAVMGRDGLLARGGSKSPVPIASITKIINALVVLEKKPLTGTAAGPNILFTSKDAAIRAQYIAEDGEVAPIAVGKTLTERQVLTISLVASANNYARALADWGYGSEPAFLAVANAWLKSHGLTHTHLADSSGINPDTRSTPPDLIRLGEMALKNPVIAGIVKIKHVTLPVVGAIDNTNTILGKSGIIGIKTGTLIPAGSSLLFASRFTHDGHEITLIGVVLDGPTHPIIDSRVRSMIATAQESFVTQQLVKKGQSFGTFRTRWGTSSQVVASRSVSSFLLRGTAVASSFTIKKVKLAKAGTTVGTAHFTVGSHHYSVPLVLAKTIKDPGVGWRLAHPGALS